LRNSGEQHNHRPLPPLSTRREQTIRYYVLKGSVREVVRTTSLLERTNRELRRKFRQVGCFSSPRGAEVAVYIQVTRLNAQWSKASWWEASSSLALDLLNFNPSRRIRYLETHKFDAGFSCTLLLYIVCKRDFMCKAGITNEQPNVYVQHRWHQSISGGQSLLGIKHHQWMFLIVECMRLFIKCTFRFFTSAIHIAHFGGKSLNC
jgi:mutator family transposase